MTLVRTDGGILRRLWRAGQRALALLAIVAGTARAHEIPASVIVRMTVKQEPSVVRVHVRVPLEAIRDIDFPVKPGTPYLDLVRADSLLRQAADTWIVSSLDLSDAGRSVDGRVVDAKITLNGAPPPAGTLAPVQSLALEADIEYPVATRDVTIDPRLARLGVRTRSVVTFQNLDGTEQMFEYAGDPGVLRLNPRWYHAAWQFITLGVAHILDGIDHLLFLICLILPFRRIRPLIGIVTSFTAAHSITLIASSLGWAPDALWFPPLIEVLIAASIVWMAIENILAASRDSTPPLGRRWLMAFTFGLIHGFGFAFALRESLQFAGRHFALSLVSFNVGVEIGQLAVLCVAVPVLGLLYARLATPRVATIIISALVTHTAWHWLADRLTALRQYRIEWTLAGLLPVIRAMMSLAIIVGVASIIARLVAGRRGGDLASAEHLGHADNSGNG